MIFDVSKEIFTAFSTMQTEFQKLDLTALFDLLSHYTDDFSKMLSGGATADEYNNCKQTIILLQSEIETRKQTAANTTVSNPNISFTEGQAE